MKTMPLALSIVITLAAGAAVIPAPEQGVTKDTILLGQPCGLKGPAAGLGTGMQTGLQACFAGVNASGGVGGRQIDLKSINDGYEPERSVEATNMLIEKIGVFAIVGPVGTPTAKATLPIAEKAGVPFIGAFTGAELLRNPFKHNAVNIRASYFQEMEALTRLIIDERGQKSVACFYQNDAYGQAGLAGIKKALEHRKLALVSEGTYERNTVAVAEALQTISASKPDAIIMVGAYKACAEFIKAAKSDSNLKDATFCNISFVGTDNLLQELGSAADSSCVISQVVPSPWDESIPVVKEYQAAMSKAGKTDQVGYVSLEGFVVGKFFCQALGRIQGEPTRDALYEAIEKGGPFDLGGFVLSFGTEDHQGSDSVFLTTFAKGRCVPLNGGTAVTIAPTD